MNGGLTKEDILRAKKALEGATTGEGLCFFLPIYGWKKHHKFIGVTMKEVRKYNRETGFFKIHNGVRLYVVEDVISR